MKDETRDRTRGRPAAALMTALTIALAALTTQAGAQGVAAGVAGRAGGAEIAAGAAGVNVDALAERLVTKTAGVREGDIVAITGDVRDLELLESLAVAVRKLGAHPLILIGSDRLTRRMFDDVPARYDAQSPELDLKLAEIVDVWITLDPGSEAGLLAHVPVERFSARGKAAQPVTELFLTRNPRQVNLGNALYPTADLAQRYGIPRDELSRIFWSGVDADPTQLAATGDAVRAALASGREIRIRNPNGTDFRAQIQGRPIFVSDGAISAEDLKRGPAGAQVWLPAGEVYVTPVPGTAQGRIVVPVQFWEGKEVRGLTLDVKEGKVTSLSAESGGERLKAQYEGAGPRAADVGVIDLGINPNVRIPEGSRMVGWMPAGMVTVAVGANAWAGGDNTTPFGLSLFLPGSTVEVDGKVLVEDGTLKVAAAQH